MKPISIPQARNVTKAVLSALHDVQSAVLHNKVPGEEPTKLETDSLTVSLARQESWQLDGLGLESKDEGFMFQLPEGMHELIGEVGDEDDNVIDTQVEFMIARPFMEYCTNF